MNGKECNFDPLELQIITYTILLKLWNYTVLMMFCHNRKEKKEWVALGLHSEKEPFKSILIYIVNFSSGYIVLGYSLFVIFDVKSKRGQIYMWLNGKYKMTLYEDCNFQSPYHCNCDTLLWLYNYRRITWRFCILTFTSK